jgi:hypothetical protein
MNPIAYKNGYTVEAFMTLASSVWPRDCDPALVEDALHHTINVGAWDGARLTVPEILVHADYQRRGVGRD